MTWRHVETYISDKHAFVEYRFTHDELPEHSVSYSLCPNTGEAGPCICDAEGEKIEISVFDAKYGEGEAQQLLDEARDILSQATGIKITGPLYGA